MRAILSTPDARDLGGTPGTIKLAYDSWRGAMMAATSLRTLATLPIDLSGIAIRTGLEIAKAGGDRSPIAKATSIARSARPDEIRVGDGLARHISADPPDGVVVRPAADGAGRSPARVFTILTAADEVPNNLPRSRTRFVGRGAEIDLLKRLVRTEPVITISGPPGTGKTRLAAGRLVDTLVDLGGRYEAGAEKSLASERYRQALDAWAGDCPSASEGLSPLGLAPG